MLDTAIRMHIVLVSLLIHRNSFIDVIFEQNIDMSIMLFKKMKKKIKYMGLQKKNVDIMKRVLELKYYGVSERLMNTVITVCIISVLHIKFSHAYFFHFCLHENKCTCII